MEGWRVVFHHVTVKPKASEIYVNGAVHSVPVCCFSVLAFFLALEVTPNFVHVGRNVWAPFTSRGPHQLCDDGDRLRHRLLLGESC